MRRLSILLVMVVQSYFSFGQVSFYKDDLQDVCLQRTTLNITEVMVHDIISPPVAARYYAYSLLSGFIAAKTIDNSITDFLNLLKDNSLSSHNFHKEGTDLELTSLYAILETAKKMLPSGYLLEQKQMDLIDVFKHNIKQETVDASVLLAVSISDKVVEWSMKDGYFSLSTHPRYKIKSGFEYWQPTPPAYMQPVEPNWKTIRTFFLDSCSQFVGPPPVLYDTSTSSGFYALCTNVYSVSKTLTDNEKMIANYWDCNPFALQLVGHLSIASKKISPGGHWINILGEVGRQRKLSFSKNIFFHAVVSMSMHDAFVSCWSQKYTTNRVRPETAIKALIDSDWQPLLQTPPFPEYTSGHSVLSTMTAELMTHFIGDNMEFLDNTGINFNMPSKRFASFKAAAEEACISRLYGGIHFKDAIENGKIEGKAISDYIIKRLNL